MVVCKGFTRSFNRFNSVLGVCCISLDREATINATFFERILRKWQFMALITSHDAGVNIVVYSSSLRIATNFRIGSMETTSKLTEVIEKKPKRDVG